MSKFGKFKNILAIGATVAKPFAPGAVNSILEIVNDRIDITGGSNNAHVNTILTTLATDNDEQTQAIFALHERIKILESKIK